MPNLGPGRSKVWWTIYRTLGKEMSQNRAADLAWELVGQLKTKGLLKAKAWKIDND
jgi:hypothetical protein